jgi:competence protein ComEA
MPAHAAAAVYQVDINRASWEEFTVLPGVGETMARRLVADRARRGPFTALDDLQRVRGIGKRTVQRLTKHLVVTSPETNAPLTP